MPFEIDQGGRDAIKKIEERDADAKRVS